MYFSGVESFIRRLGGFGGAIGATKARRSNFPDGVAIKALIVCGDFLLQALVIAFGTDAALVEPVAVGVEAVLDVIFGNLYVKVACEQLGSLPGSYFELYKL